MDHSISARRLWPRRRPEPPPRPAPPLEVTFLGTAAASGLATSATAATLLRLGEHRLLVDCGRSAAAQLRRAGADPARLTAVLLTHWHTDHVAGLAQLLAARRGRGLPPLLIYCPPPPRGVGRTLGLGRGGFEVALRPMSGGQSFRIAGATLTAVGADHVVSALAWHLGEDGPEGRRVLFSGDTRPTPAVLEAARGADLLVHEATFADRHADWARRIGHTTAADAARLARDAGAGALALTHISLRDPRGLIAAEAEPHFPGVHVAADLDVIEVVAMTAAERRAARAGMAAGWARIRHRSPGTEVPTVA